MESELNNVDLDEAAKLFTEDDLKIEGLKSNTKSNDTSRRNRSKSPSTSKNKKNKKSENKKKKKNKGENESNEKGDNSLNLSKLIDKDKNEEKKDKENQKEKEEGKEEKKDNNESGKPVINENNNVEVKKNRKKKKSENEDEKADRNVKEKENITQNEKKEKKKGKGKKKKTSDEGVDESKNDNKSKIKGKSKDKSKNKKKEEFAKIDDPKKYVYDYMKAQNRPYSLINIFDNLHGAVKKSQLVKILDALVEEGSLIMKEYNTKIYLFNQDKLDIKVTDADIDKIQKEIDEKREENKRLKEEISSKANELKILTLSLTDDELKAKIKELKKELSKMKIKVDDIKENKIDPIPLEKMNEAKENFEKELKIFKKTKKICVEIINDISDGMELKLKDTYDKIGIETDDDLMKQLNVDQTLINGK